MSCGLCVGRARKGFTVVGIYAVLDFSSCFNRWCWRPDQCMKVFLKVVAVQCATIFKWLKFWCTGITKIAQENPGFHLQLVLEMKECLPWMCPVDGSNSPCIYEQCLEQYTLEDVCEPLQLSIHGNMEMCATKLPAKSFGLKILEKHSEVHIHYKLGFGLFHLKCTNCL